MVQVHDEQTLRALVLRRLRRWEAIERDLAYYDRLPPGCEEKSYDYEQSLSAATYAGFETSFAVRSVAVG